MTNILHICKHPCWKVQILPAYLNASRTFSCITINKDRLRKNDKIPNYQRQISRNLSANGTIYKLWTDMSNSTPVHYVQESLIQIHNITGLPWWATIVLSTLLLRTFIIFPLAVYQNKIAARLENITLEMPGIVAELKKETAIAMKRYNWTQNQARSIYNKSLKKQWNNLVIRDNCHPMKTFIVIWGQLPLWIFQSVALRNLVYMLPNPNSIEAQVIFAEMTLGGFGWIPNLTEVDASFILPVALGMLNYTNIQIQAWMRTSPPTRLQRYATNVFKVLSVCMVPIAATVPSCICIYWVTSSFYGIVQNLILLKPSVRRLLGIPKTTKELQEPYQHLLEALRK